MSRRIVIAQPGQSLAIRVDERTLLAVPPMPPGLPSAVRVKVFEYILRRQPGLAQAVADASPERPLVPLALVQERPHATARVRDRAA